MGGRVGECPSPRDVMNVHPAALGRRTAHPGRSRVVNRPGLQGRWAPLRHGGRWRHMCLHSAAPVSGWIRKFDDPGRLDIHEVPGAHFELLKHP
ncbi:Hypothetical protein AA314_01676 [Archangium gephyra]|uniref:Uncharacterized protein n=1 Tax=Archangium gephyra TaxID=48 RepID=A0AAC8Q2U9_9BACT|nr:Hypothetical protein AA314_01676 [Archangium gephyra]